MVPVAGYAFMGQDPSNAPLSAWQVAAQLRHAGVRLAVVIAAGAALTTTAAMSAAATRTAARIAADEQRHSTNTSRIASVRARVGERARSSEPAMSTMSDFYLFTSFQHVFWMVFSEENCIFSLGNAIPKIFFACGALRNGSLRSPGQLEYHPRPTHPRHPGPPRRYPGASPTSRLRFATTRCLARVAGPL